MAEETRNLPATVNAPRMPEELPESVRAELEALSSTQKAAVLMLLLGEQQAADIIKYMNPKEVQALGGAMTSVQDLSQEAVSAVLDEFIATIKKQTTLGLGSSDYVENVLKRALGEDKAASVLSRIMPGSSSKGLDILRWMDARSISEMIRAEHPQVIAIIMSVCDFDVAADILAYLPQEIRPEVLRRIASLETVQPSAMKELEKIMNEQFSKSSSAKSSSFGGVKAAARIMNFTKADLEGPILNGLTEIDPEISMKVQDNMFQFENLSGVDNRSIQTLMRNVDQDMLMVALKGATEPVKEKFFGNMSARARVMFIDEMEAKGPLRLTDVEEAQKGIMRIAKKLSDKNEIILGGGGDDFV